MNVLLVHEDAAFRGFVKQVLRGSGFVVQELAGESIRFSNSGSIVLTSAGRLRRVLAVGGAGDRYVIACVSGDDEATLVAAIVDGADDAVFTPLSPAALRSRLALARTHLERTSRATRAVRHALETVLDRGTSGMLTVRGTQQVGTIHVHNGRIAWVERAGHTTTLVSLLGRFGIQLSAETSREVLHEARIDNRHFTEVLGERGVVDAATAHECLRNHIALELSALLGDTTATALFVPQDPRRASSFGFAPQEVLPAHTVESGLLPGPTARPSAAPPSLGDEHLTMLQQISQLPGCVGVSLLERSGAALATLGRDLEPGAAFAVTQTMGGATALTVERTSEVLLARALHDRVIVAAFSLRHTNLGLARISMNGCLGRLADSLPPSAATA